MASITTIPTEILGEIFFHCTSSSPDAPLTLSAVCRTFHCAARASPHIWRRLRLSISEEADIDRGAARKAELWFGMAGACALDVSVEIPKASPILDESDSLVHSRGAQAPLLSSVLHRRRERITSLALHAYTERQAHSFLDSIYAPLSLSSKSASTTDNAVALRRLTLFVTPDLLPIEEQQVPAFIPLLSSLTYLKLTSPGIPSLTAANLSNLRTLAIVRPIRSHPLPLESIVDVLLASHVLVHFDLETRLDLPLEPSPTLPSALSPSDLYHTSLITMPSLSHLSLRTNNNPVLLSRLVVPALHTLHLNALDGKRPGRAEETATALRKMLARMDTNPSSLSPSLNPNTTTPTRTPGIEVLELAGVSIYRPPHARTNASWEWCLRHMRRLTHISARNMDAEHLIELLSQGMRRASVPGYIAPQHPHDGSAPDTAVCPRLRRLAVPAPATEASSAMRAFRVARPFVRVVPLGVAGGGVGYGWDSEDALKPSMSARALVGAPLPTPAPTPVSGSGFGPSPVSAPAVLGGGGGGGRTGFGGFGSGFGGFGSRLGRTDLVQTSPRSVKPDAGPSVNVPLPSPATSPPVIVGGFGFGSSFSRMRQTQSPPAPLPDFKAMRRDGVNW
ncbi:hypothetical protein BDZ94DRAFT_1234403 [Collybia nuda]|uniref:F-box domain-containing protein n=1 Tax=Collybia nuda TaxID=64659 RepID=A0A9P5YBU0_9AGAR|nr:hypothetical protein BDZ94DRAFT_1234403 [Collybia nuda]